MVGIEEQKVSKFNAGLLQMERIHKLFMAINLSWISPTKKDEFGLYGYEVIHSALTSLFMEASGKLSPIQIEQFMKARNKITNFIDTKVIVKSIYRKGGKSAGVVPTMNWKLLKEGLFQFELMVRGYLELTGLNSPRKGEEALL